MLNIEIRAFLKSNSHDPFFVKERVQDALRVLASLHEPNEPIQIATVEISEVITTLNPVIEGGFFTDTLEIR